MPIPVIDVPPRAPTVPGWAYFLIEWNGPNASYWGTGMIPLIPSRDPSPGDSATQYCTDMLDNLCLNFSTVMHLGATIRKVGFYWGTSLGVQRYVYTLGGLPLIVGAVAGNTLPNQCNVLLQKNTVGGINWKGRFWFPGVPVAYVASGELLTPFGLAAYDIVGANFTTLFTSQAITFLPAVFRPSLNAMEPTAAYKINPKVGRLMRRGAFRLTAPFFWLASNLWMY